MIIGISGKVQSGKDTVAKIIQYLVLEHKCGKDELPYTIKEYLEGKDVYNVNYVKDYTESISQDSGWQVKKFADALKDIVCILTGCTREQLEDIDFKNSKLPDEWIRYGYADGFIKEYIGNGDMGTPIMKNKQCDKERYEIELKTNWQTAYKSHITYRELLQYLGTDLFRNKLNDNCWVNALMSKYDNLPEVLNRDHFHASKDKLYNWIISDVRFPNELEAIKQRNGITIRVNRQCNGSSKFEGTQEEWKLLCERNKNSQHISETALDNASFDHIITSNGAIEELIEKVKEILIKEKIL